jgi:hypothetical protein
MWPGGRSSTGVDGSEVYLVVTYRCAVPMHEDCNTKLEVRLFTLLLPITDESTRYSQTLSNTLMFGFQLKPF